MSWDERFLQLAEHVAAWSKDPSTKVGAAIARPNKTIASIGYNGFPRGVCDSEYRYADRDIKLMLTVHAEVNAILHAREPLDGCTIYVSPLLPCVDCAGIIIQSGITRVVSRGVASAQWESSCTTAMEMLDEADVTVVSLEKAPCTQT